MKTVDRYFAKKKMKIKKIDSKSIFLSTVWKGEVVICVFDTSVNKLLEINCFRSLSFEEINQFENIITECLSEKI